MKRILFAACLALIAIGGATAQTEGYLPGSQSGTPDAICDGSAMSCSEFYNTDVLYETNAVFPNEQDENNDIDISSALKD